MHVAQSAADPERGMKERPRDASTGGGTLAQAATVPAPPSQEGGGEEPQGGRPRHPSRKTATEAEAGRERGGDSQPSGEDEPGTQEAERDGREGGAGAPEAARQGQGGGASQQPTPTGASQSEGRPPRADDRGEPPSRAGSHPRGGEGREETEDPQQRPPLPQSQ
jgi:hypothetical protein